MRASARTLLVVGGAGVVASAFLPWLTVEGPSFRLALLDTTVSTGARTVTGTETMAWPWVVGVGAVVGVLAVFNVARRLLGVLGVTVAVAGGALLYYAANVVDIETAARSGPERLLAGAALSSSPEVGAFLLLVGGIVIVFGALLR